LISLFIAFTGFDAHFVRGRRRHRLRVFEWTESKEDFRIILDLSIFDWWIDYY
jgi:hypothetical protein